MSEITTLKLWRDTGFTEGNVEVPKISSLSLASPDVTIEEGLYPSKEAFFSQVKIEGEYLNLFDMSYMEVTYEFNNPKIEGETSTSSLSLYAWIDEVDLQSDNDDKPITIISYHIDYWRTYAAMANYGYGMVTKRPRGTADPIQYLPYRYRLPGDFTPLAYNGRTNIAWLYLAFNYKYSVGSGQSTTQYAGNKIGIIPVNCNPANIHTSVYFKVGQNGTTHTGLTMSDIINNRFDEILGLDPSNISACYISKIPPFIITGTGTQADPLVLLAGTGTSHSDPVSRTYSDTAKHQISFNKTSNADYRVNWSDGTYTDYSYLQIDNYKGPFGTFTSGNCSYWVDTDWSTAGNYGYFYICKLDDYVRECIGTDQWNALSIGDVLTMSDTMTLCDSYTVAFNPGNYSPYPRGFKITRTNTSTAVSLTAASGTTGITFGNKYVCITNTSNQITITSNQISNVYEIEAEKQSTRSDEKSYYITSRSNNFAEISQSLSIPIKTTDTKEWIFTDYTGNSVGSAPWGIELSDYTVRAVVTTTGGYIEYRFGGLNARARGTCYMVAMPTVDVVSNAWSSYVYSGQRDYDIAQRDIANKQTLMSNILGTGSLVGAYMGYEGAASSYDYWNTRGAADESMTGKMANKVMEKVVPPMANGNKLASLAGNVLVSRAAWGTTGALGGVAINAVASGLKYGIQEQFNKKLQEITDSYKAKQSEAISAYGTGWDWLWHGRECGFISLVADDYSLQQFNSSIDLNGISCSEPMSSCDTLIKAAEGPLQVTNLIVTGDIPVQAKYAIADKLSAGVRLI